MDKVDHTEILMARNRTRRQHKVYLYDAEIGFLTGFAGGTVSDNIHAIVSAFLLRIGKQMDFLKERDRLRIKQIRRAITSCRRRAAIRPASKQKQY